MNWILSSLLAVSIFVLPTRAAAEEQARLFSRALSLSDSARLYGALAVAETSDGGLHKKSLNLESEGVSIECMAADAIVYTCSITIAPSQITRGRVNFGGSAAEALYAALAVEEFSGFISDSKVFASWESSVELYCSKSDIPNGSPYFCTLSLN